MLRVLLGMGGWGVKERQWVWKWGVAVDGGGGGGGERANGKSWCSRH